MDARSGSGISLVLRNYPDVYIVVALLLLNAILGFFQEQRASGAVDTLKQKLRVNARALRDGTWQIIPARDLVPGDIVRIRAGDFVPADVKLLEGQIEVDQSALTGEIPHGYKRKVRYAFFRLCRQIR